MNPLEAVGTTLLLTGSLRRYAFMRSLLNVLDWRSLCTVPDTAGLVGAAGRGSAYPAGCIWNGDPLVATENGCLTCVTSLTEKQFLPETLG